MPIERVWPKDVYVRTHPHLEGPAYAQVVVGKRRSVSIAGTFAFTPDFELVGGASMREQVRGAMDNIGKSLAAVGGTPADIVRTKTYVTDIEAYIQEGHQQWLNFFGDTLPASTTVQVVALADERCLVEIEAYAELD